MASKKGFFEQKIREASPGYVECSQPVYAVTVWLTPVRYVKGEQKPVGQREWNPNPLGIRGGHDNAGYNLQTTNAPRGTRAQQAAALPPK